MPQKIKNLKTSVSKLENSQKIASFLNFIIIFIVGFFIGQIRSLYLNYNRTQAIYVDQYYNPAVSLVKLEKIIGDELYFSITGNSRVIWGENFRENSKNQDKNFNNFKLPLGQIPNEQDLELTKFKYLGNAKTKKFYPTNSYPARGTEYKYRRFFQTKQEAIKSGFIASKLVK
jgi:hypothetical protein